MIVTQSHKLNILFPFTCAGICLTIWYLVFAIKVTVSSLYRPMYHKNNDVVANCYLCICVFNGARFIIGSKWKVCKYRRKLQNYKVTYVAKGDTGFYYMWDQCFVGYIGYFDRIGYKSHVLTQVKNKTVSETIHRETITNKYVFFFKKHHSQVRLLWSGLRRMSWNGFGVHYEIVWKIFRVVR